MYIPLFGVFRPDLKFGIGGRIDFLGVIAVVGTSDVLISR
jgi:hypothetical protein